MIKAIETRYNGYRFRSRLEARWAVFFDALGIPWRYELDGFEATTTGKPARYLPDFLVGLFGAGHTWFEIKPYVFDEKGYTPDVRRTLKVMTELCYMPVEGIETNSFAGYVAAGEPSTNRLGVLAVPMFHDGTVGTEGEPVVGTVTGCLARLAACPSCHKFCFLVEGTKDDTRLQVLCGCFDPRHRMYLKPNQARNFLEAPHIVRAIEAARGARFEFGETPKTPRGKPKKGRRND